jgi:hypothetical protein
MTVVGGATKIHGLRIFQAVSRAGRKRMAGHSFSLKIIPFGD